VPLQRPLGICWAFSDLLTADLSGADQRAVAHTADMVGRFSPDWSPKESRILFAWSTLDEGWGLACYPSTAVFSPDGTRIAFATSDLSAYPEGEAVPRIDTVDVAGGEPRPVAAASGYLTDWVPD
jgi:Tol biopolymer transport system component